MNRIVSLLGITIVAMAPNQLLAQSLVIGANQASGQVTPSFVDNRPLPENLPNPKMATRETLLRQQQDQIRRLTEAQNQAVLSAKQANQELAQYRAQNVALRSQQETLTAERTALQENLRLLKQQGSSDAKISDVRDTLRKQLQNIKRLKSRQLKLQTTIANSTKERDQARAKLAKTEQDLGRAQETNRFLKSELNKSKIKLLAAQKTQDTKRQRTLALQKSRDRLQAELARQKNMTRKASSELATARQTITSLSGQLKAKSPAALTATTAPTVNTVTQARRRALAEALRRARAARKRANQAGAATSN